MYHKSMAQPNSIYENAVVIGAGIGGLAAACLLAADGVTVTVLEKNERIGGKMNQFEAQGYRFDTGPSLLTMPGVLTQLFAYCGKDVADYLEFSSLSPVCRYQYPDGTVFNAYDDLDKTCREIRHFAPEDEQPYRDFLAHTKTLYERTADVFLFHPLQNAGDLLQMPIMDAFKIDALTTVSKKVDQFFSSGYLRQFFKRFATYNGSSPYMAPGTINVIPHVEMNMGGYYVKGGLYRVAEAMYALAESMGVKFCTCQDVKQIVVQQGKVTGVTTVSNSYTADLVVSNADAYESYLTLLDSKHSSLISRKIMEYAEPSCSGFVLMLGCNRRWEDVLVHHNIFFSNDYPAEFDDIFKHKRLPEDPTIYIANTSTSDPSHAPHNGSNLFILVNAPYLHSSQDWPAITSVYADKLIQLLEKRGLSGLRESIEVQETINPMDFYQRYRSNKGSIYGTSSNSKMAAFLRPRNRHAALENLWMVGGSTHPGGGIPLALLSAFHACGVPVDSGMIQR